MASVGKISSRVTEAKIIKLSLVLEEATNKLVDVQTQMQEWAKRNPDDNFGTSANTLEKILIALERIQNTLR